MKLKVYQQGGGLIYTPFIPEQSVPQNSKKSSSDDSEDIKLDPLDKELLSLMKDQNLLPSDINMIFNKLIQFQKRTQKLSNIAGFEGAGSYRSVMPGMLQIMQMISNAKYNKAKSDDAIKQMTNQNTGADVALDKYGRMYVQNNDGEIKHIAPSEYDSEKYRPISNSELLYLRENSLGFDTDILSDVGQTVGMDAISKEISRIISEFGTTKSEEYYDKEAVKVFTALNSPDGIYKLTEEKSSADLRKAWSIIYKQLPTKMQHVLNARAALSNSNPVDYIHEIVLSNLDYTQSIDYDATQSKAAGFGGGSGSGGSEKTVKDTYAERLVSGNGLDPEQWLNIMPTNTGIVLNAYSQNAGPLVKGGNRLYNTNLQVVLTQADAVGGIVDAQSITFGNQLLNTNDYTNIMVNNNVNMKRVYLPVRYTDDGRVTPDFNAQRLLEKIQYRFKTEQFAEAWINEWLSQNLPQAHYNPQTKKVEFDQRYVRPFLVLNGIAARNRAEFDSDSPYLHHLSGDEGIRLKEEYGRIVTEETINDKVNHKKAPGANRWKYYSGNIYLPISGPVVGAALYNDQYFPQETYTNITQRARANEVRQNMITNF